MMMDKTAQDGTTVEGEARQGAGTRRPYEAPRVHCLLLGDSESGKFPGTSESHIVSGVTVGAIS